MPETVTEGAVSQDRPILVEADYLVVGAGAAGMAFVDSLIHNAEVHVAMIDRRHSAGGHWLDAYPFVRLHQASEFYGVVSTPLGDGGLQLDGPETGMHHRAPAAEIVAYYAQVLERMVSGGQVTFHPNSVEATREADAEKNRLCVPHAAATRLDEAAARYARAAAAGAVDWNNRNPL
jgi:cation diffusion facilitator CzcD-associated flavoprotein CzcO